MAPGDISIIHRPGYGESLDICDSLPLLHNKQLQASKATTMGIDMLKGWGPARADRTQLEEGGAIKSHGHKKSDNQGHSLSYFLNQAALGDTDESQFQGHPSQWLISSPPPTPSGRTVIAFDKHTAVGVKKILAVFFFIPLLLVIPLMII